MVIGQEAIGALTVTRREDGTYCLDWAPPAGPVVVVNAVQWAALCRLIRRAR